MIPLKVLFFLTLMKILLKINNIGNFVNFNSINLLNAFKSTQNCIKKPLKHLSMHQMADCPSVKTHVNSIPH